MKKVYKFNDGGIFAGETLLDESDLSPLEPGVYLIPSGCTEIEPPLCSSLEFARFENDKWVVQPIPVSEPDPEGSPEAPPTVQEKLAALDASNTLTQRNLRETIMLMSEAFKQATSGAVDLSQIPGVAKVYEVEAQAEALRAQL